MVFLAAIARFVCTSWSIVAATLVLSAGLTGQVIDFESNGLHYQALTRNSVTVTFAKLPSHIAAYNVFQVTITNGSPVSWVVKPEDFTFSRQDGSAIRATPADVVIASLLSHAS